MSIIRLTKWTVQRYPHAKEFVNHIKMTRPKDVDGIINDLNKYALYDHEYSIMERFAPVAFASVFFSPILGFIVLLTTFNLGILDCKKTKKEYVKFYKTIKE